MVLFRSQEEIQFRFLQKIAKMRDLRIQRFQSFGGLVAFLDFGTAGQFLRHFQPFQHIVMTGPQRGQTSQMGFKRAFFLENRSQLFWFAPRIRRGQLLFYFGKTFGMTRLVKASPRAFQIAWTKPPSGLSDQ